MILKAILATLAFIVLLLGVISLAILVSMAVYVRHGGKLDFDCEDDEKENRHE